MKVKVPRFDRKTSRVSRGGCWDSYPGLARVASRGGSTPDYRFNFLGFRLALWR